MKYLSKIYQLKGLKPKDKGHTNFYEFRDLTKKVYLGAPMVAVAAVVAKRETVYRNNEVTPGAIYYLAHRSIQLEITSTENIGTSNLYIPPKSIGPIAFQ